MSEIEARVEIDAFGPGHAVAGILDLAPEFWPHSMTEQASFPRGVLKKMVTYQIPIMADYTEAEPADLYMPFRPRSGVGKVAADLVVAVFRFNSAIALPATNLIRKAPAHHGWEHQLSSIKTKTNSLMDYGIYMKV